MAKKPTKKKTSGRKALWDELDMINRLDMVKGWALQGSTDADIMQMLGVGKNLFYQWKKEKLEFKDALKKGRYDSNGEILNSAFKQATGYYQRVEEPFKIKTMQEFQEANGRTVWQEVEEVVNHEYMKFIPANNTMAIFMLKNRIPEHYKDKQDINHTGSVVTANVDLSYMTDDELEKALKKYGDA